MLRSQRRSGRSVTGRTASPRRCQPISRSLFQIPFLADRATVPDGAREWDRILACVGTSGIPTAEKPKKPGVGEPGKGGRAVFAFYAQGLCSETSPKKWDLILTWRAG